MCGSVSGLVGTVVGGPVSGAIAMEVGNLSGRAIGSNIGSLGCLAAGSMLGLAVGTVAAAGTGLVRSTYHIVGGASGMTTESVSAIKESWTVTSTEGSRQTGLLCKGAACRRVTVLFACPVDGCRKLIKRQSQGSGKCGACSTTYTAWPCSGCGEQRAAEGMFFDICPRCGVLSGCVPCPYNKRPTDKDGAAMFHFCDSQSESVRANCLTTCRTCSQPFHTWECIHCAKFGRCIAAAREAATTGEQDENRCHHCRMVTVCVRCPKCQRARTHADFGTYSCSFCALKYVAWQCTFCSKQCSAPADAEPMCECELPAAGAAAATLAQPHEPAATEASIRACVSPASPVLTASLGSHPECTYCDNLATFVYLPAFCPELDVLAQRVLCEACVLRRGLRSHVQSIACATAKPVEMEQPAEMHGAGGMYSGIYGSAAAVGSAIVYIPNSLYGAAGQALHVLGTGLGLASAPQAPDAKDVQDWGGHTPPNSGPPSPREHASGFESEDSGTSSSDVEAES